MYYAFELLPINALSVNIPHPVILFYPVNEVSKLLPLLPLKGVTSPAFHIINRPVQRIAWMVNPEVGIFLISNCLFHIRCKLSNNLFYKLPAVKKRKGIIKKLLLLIHRPNYCSDYSPDFFIFIIRCLNPIVAVSKENA